MRNFLGNCPKYNLYYINARGHFLGNCPIYHIHILCIHLYLRNEHAHLYRKIKSFTNNLFNHTVGDNIGNIGNIGINKIEYPDLMTPIPTPISSNTIIGTKVATVTIIQKIQQVVYIRLSSRADANDNLYPVVFGITPNATDPSRITPVPSGEWNGSQWISITEYRSQQTCSGEQYSQYSVGIYVTSTVYPEGNWTISLNFNYQPPYDLPPIRVKGTSCLPSERFDVASKRCVVICGCGLIATEEVPITCTLRGKHTSFVYEFSLINNLH